MTIATPSSASFLDDGLTLYAPTGGGLQTGFGKVAGVNRIIDTGSASVPWNGVAALELSVLRRDGDQTYLLIIEGSKVSNFASATQDLATFTPGAINPQDVLHLKNTFDDEVYRYLRLKWVVTGTNPEIKGLVFIKSISDLDQLSLGDSLTVFSLLATNSHNANTNFRTWMTGHAYGGPNADGKYPLSDGLGNTVLVACPAKWAADASGASPLFYGAIGDGHSHKAREFYDNLSELQAVYPFAVSLDQEMDYLGIQAAVNRKKAFRCTFGHFVIFNRDGDPQIPLKFISGESNAHFDRSVIDARQLLPREATDTDQIARNYEFDTNTHWQNAHIYSPEQIVFATFGGGKATMLDATFTGPFYQWGQLVSLAPGDYEITLTVKATLGDSYSHGNYNPPYCGMGFFSSSPGEGHNPWGATASWNPNVWDTRGYDETTLVTTFHVGHSGSAWLTFSGGGYANFEVTKFTLTRKIMNCAMWFTRDGASEHYPMTAWVESFRLWGPGGLIHKNSVGLYHVSFQTIDGDHSYVSDFEVKYFGTAQKHGSGSYLLCSINARMVENYIAIDFPYGVKNAGENMRYFGCGIAGNVISVSNGGGASFHFFGTSFDYNDIHLQWSNAGIVIHENNGSIEMHGCHVEQRTIRDRWVNVFQNKHGSIYMDGGVVLISDGINESVSPLIKNEYNTSQFTFNRTMLYNVGCVLGVLAEGAGSVRGNWINRGNPNFGTMLSETRYHDVLGDAGGFEDINGTQPPHTNANNKGYDDIGIDGGVYVGFEGEYKQYGKWVNQQIRVERSPDYARTGEKSLRIRKMDRFGGYGQDILFLIPVDSVGQDAFAKMHFFTPGKQTYGNAFTKWSNLKSSDITVSADGMTATRTNDVNGEHTYCIGDTAITGKTYIEFTLNNVADQDGKFRVGVIDTYETTPNEIGQWGSAAYYSPVVHEVPTTDPLATIQVTSGSELRINEVLMGHFGPKRSWNHNWWLPSDVVGCAVDTDKRTIMWRLNDGEWTPPFHYVGATVTPVVALSQIDDQVTLNCGRKPYKYTPPVGYGPMDEQVSYEQDIGFFVGLSSQGIAVTSSDGEDWTDASNVGAQAWRSIAWSRERGICVAVSQTGATYRVISSPDGVSWTPRTTPLLALRSVVWAGDRQEFIATSNGVGTLRSADGITWESAGNLPSSKDWLSVCWSDALDLYCAVSHGASGSIATSPDGITWTAVPSVSRSFRSVLWVHNLQMFIAVYDQAGTVGRVMTSPNGIAWTERTSPMSSFNCVAWAEELGLLVATADSGSQRIMTSHDGLKWIGQNITSSALRAVAWSPELRLFLAVGSAGTDRMLVSENGFNWEPVAITAREYFPLIWAQKAQASVIYRRHFWVRVTGRDEYDRPILGKQDTFTGENNWIVPLQGMDDWETFAFQSTYSDPSTDLDETMATGKPYWATHWALVLGLGSMDARSIYIDDFIANFF